MAVGVLVGGTGVLVCVGVGVTVLVAAGGGCVLVGAGGGLVAVPVGCAGGWLVAVGWAWADGVSAAAGVPAGAVAGVLEGDGFCVPGAPQAASNTSNAVHKTIELFFICAPCM